MARANIGQAALDATIAVGGGTLINTYVIDNVQALSDLIAKIPVQDIAGISVPLVISGIAALIIAKMMMK